MGRTLQKEYGQPPQIVLLMPILEGLDGVKKMSKSLGNYVGITEPPNEMFGKLMSIPDDLMRRYFELCTTVPMDEVDRRLREDHPRDVKFWLGREIITIYHGASEAQAAQDEFVRVFSQKEVPTDMREARIARADTTDGKMFIVKLLVHPSVGLASSNRESRRLVEQGSVSVDGEKVTDMVDIDLTGSPVLKVGRRYVQVILE